MIPDDLRHRPLAQGLRRRLGRERVREGSASFGDVMLEATAPTPCSVPGREAKRGFATSYMTPRTRQGHFLTFRAPDPGVILGSKGW